MIQKGRNKMFSPEEKEKIIKEYLEGQSTSRIESKYDINRKRIYDWLRKYQNVGIEGLESKTGKLGKGKGRLKNPVSEEEKLKLEILKLEIEVARLKKGYMVKGVGAKKVFVTTFKKNMK